MSTQPKLIYSKKIIHWIIIAAVISCILAALTISCGMSCGEAWLESLVCLLFMVPGLLILSLIPDIPNVISSIFINSIFIKSLNSISFAFLINFIPFLDNFYCFYFK